MAIFCACGGDGKSGNTGVSDSSLQLKRPSLLVFVRTFADDGTKNVINASDFVNGVLPSSFIEDKINAVDESKRWFVVPDILANTNVRADPNTQTFDAGKNTIITSEGLRDFTATQESGNAKYKDNLDKLACKKISFFEIDECGSLGGELSVSNKEVFEPHPIAKRTFYVNLVKAQAGDGQTLSIQFQYSQLSNDGRECIIPDGSIEGNALELEGLLNLIPEYSNVTTTGFTVDLSLEYGGFTSMEKVTGLVAADFTLYNVTQDAAVTIDSFTPTSNEGVYDVTFAAQAASDVIELRQASTAGVYDKKGFELCVEQVTI